MKIKITQGMSKLLLYNGLTKDSYNEIRPLIMQRNEQTLKISSLFVIIFSLTFLIINVITRAGTLFPYAFLAAGGVIVFFLNRIPNKKEWFLLSLCYAIIFFTLVYSMFLSFQPSNITIPATSFIVFIAIVPLTIDDRPVRMIPFILIFSAVFLTISFFTKESKIFRLDMMNLMTFVILGLVLYVLICRRNVKEIYQSVKVERLQKDIISSFATVIEERDENTGEHIIRTEDYVQKLLAMMKSSGRYSSLTSSYCDNVVRAAPMHDIGKIKIPDAILNKPGKLDDKEFDVMKKHTAYGADIIQKTIRNSEEDGYYDVAYNLALYHHERFDGKGYPSGLKGNEIPLEARIMALADVYDALISERVYKKPFTKEEAKKIIKDERGTHFDPDLTDLFIKALDNN